MEKTTFTIIIILIAFLAQEIFAGDITVNSQSTYAVPPNATNVLILDLTLPENLTSIKMLNLGDAQQWDISAVHIFEDGSSAGFDGDEKEIARKTTSPFWDTEISANSSKSRIFVTVNIASGAASGKTIKPKAAINSDKTIIGFERTILAGASTPLVPAAPLAKNGEALSSSVIRWHFLDLANNEFGFRVKSPSLKTVAEQIGENLSFIDEKGLEPSACYSGRRAFAFNDRGESLPSLNFAEVCTLPAPAPPSVAEEPIIEPASVPDEIGTTAGKETSEDINITIRQKIIEILSQIIQLLQEKIASLQANISLIFNWLMGK